MVDYVKVSATAKRLIEKNGRDVTLYRQERDPGDPTKPWRGVATSTNPEATLGPIKTAFVPPRGTGLGQVFQNKDGELRRMVDTVGLVARDSIDALSPSEPNATKYDTLVDSNGRHYEIVLVEELAPGDKVVLYVLGLKS